MGASAAIWVALGAAACFGGGNALQHRSATGAPGRHFLRPRLLGHLLTRPLWLAGTVFAGAGLLLHVLALDLGPLTVVQPLLVTSLVFGLLVAAWLDRRRLLAREVGWALATVIGLAAFLLVARPGPPQHAVDLDDPGLVLLPVAAFVGLTVAWSRRGSPWRRALALGVATGACFGVLAALVKVIIDEFDAGNLATVALSWPLYTLLAVGALGLLLNMSAFQVGPLGASLAAITIVDPVVSVALGVAGFGERLAATPADVAAEVAALLLMSVGVAATAQFAAGRGGGGSNAAGRGGGGSEATG